MEEERAIHPDCRNASNPYHECSDYCFGVIADAMLKVTASDAGREASCQGTSLASGPEDQEERDDAGPEEHSDGEAVVDGGDAAADFSNLKGRQKKLFELKMKMNAARKANQTAMVAEKKTMEAPTEARGISKQKWLEERKRKAGKLLDANGLDMSKAYMLDTQEMAESKYKKWEKEHAPAGWDVFNQRTLYNAYKKRTKNIKVDLDTYNRLKEEDPEFYRTASSLQYGKAPNIPEDKVDKMVKELTSREEK